MYKRKNLFCRLVSPPNVVFLAQKGLHCRLWVIFDHLLKKYLKNYRFAV